MDFCKQDEANLRSMIENYRAGYSVRLLIEGNQCSLGSGW